MIFSGFLRRNIVFVIVLVAMIFSATTALATPLTKQSVPLKISLDLHEEVGFRLDCPSQFGGSTTGTGKGTHLGKVSFNATDCITPAEGYFTFEGEFILAAANGDELIGNYGGLFIPVDSGPTHRLLDAMMEITGGTGRFSGVTGSAELTGTQDITTGDGAFAADGAMSNPSRGPFKKAPMRAPGAAFRKAAALDDYLAMFRNFPTVDSLEETSQQPTLVLGSVSGSNARLVSEPAVFILLGTGLVALQFAQRLKKC